MSEYAEKPRAEMRAKAQKLGSSPPNPDKTDASDWSPESPEKANIQTGPRPVSRRAYRSGGKVAGEMKANAGRKPRASGGMTADDFINRNVKSANEKRDGEKHEGGMKKGGRAARASGGECERNDSRKDSPWPMKARLSAPPKKGAGLKEEKPKGTMPQVERAERKSGGRAKDKMNVNIIIGAQKPAMPMPPPGMGGPPPGVPAPPPPQGMTPGPGAPAPMGPMARKSGGRAYPLTAGGGGGRGRLEKAKAYG